MKASVDTTSAFVRSQAQSNPFVGILETLLNVQRDLDRMSESFQQDIDQLQNKLKNYIISILKLVDYSVIVWMN